MPYVISNHSKKQAKKLNLIIKVSTRKNKKIDVYDADNNYINSIGDINYNDYGSFLKIFGQIFANNKRDLYHARHKKGVEIINSKQYLSANLLW